VAVQVAASESQASQTVLAFVPPATSFMLVWSRFLRVSALSESFFTCFFLMSTPFRSRAERQRSVAPVKSITKTTMRAFACKGVLRKTGDFEEGLPEAR